MTPESARTLHRLLLLAAFGSLVACAPDPAVDPTATRMAESAAPAPPPAPAGGTAATDAAPPSPSSSAGVDPECVAWSDDAGLLRLGQVPLSTAFEAVDADFERDDQCFVSADRGTVDCELIDEDGVAYLADARGVVRIEARSGEAGAATLPLGLGFGDSRDQVASRLQAMLPAAAPLDQLLSQRERLVWATGECIVHPAAPPASWYVEFHVDRGLERVGLRLSVN